MLKKPKEQLEIIMKGGQHIIDEDELLTKLNRSYAEKKPMVIKLGLDPSAPDIHLGHAVVLRKIKQSGVKLNQKKIKEEDVMQTLKMNDVIQIGKKKFIQCTITK